MADIVKKPIKIMRCKAKMLDIAFFMVYNDKVNGVA